MSEKDGIFDAKMELKLTSCSSLTPFSEPVELADLRGVTSIAVKVTQSTNACARVDVAKDCGKIPRLIVLRPMSLQLTPTKRSVNNPDIWEWDTAKSQWVDAKKSASGIAADQLAACVSFQPPTMPADWLGLGRPQFYYDGLLNLLVGEAAAYPPVTQPATEPPIQSETSWNTPYETPPLVPPVSAGDATINFQLTELIIDKDGREKGSDVNLGQDHRKLEAVIVQFIAAYGNCPEK